MKVKYIQFFGLLLIVCYFGFIAAVYWTEPQTIADVPSSTMTAIENVATTGQIMTGQYEIDRELFDAGLRAFRRDDFILARDRFYAADPEKRDPETQFYIAYSFYRQGWGRVSSDDVLFRQGLTAVDRVLYLNPRFVSTDADLKMHTPAELKTEIEEGLRFSADDMNPLRLMRERK